jgi:hypothetical protein
VVPLLDIDMEIQMMNILFIQNELFSVFLLVVPLLDIDMEIHVVKILFIQNKLLSFLF